VPATDPPRSYSQWEYLFALGERLDGSLARPKETYLYLASAQCLATRSVDQSAEHRRRQLGFYDQLKAGSKDWVSFENLDQLCRRVLRDGWQIDRRPRPPRNLPLDSLGRLFMGRDDLLLRVHGDSPARPLRPKESSRQVIFGLGGAGKTRLAVEYALRYEREYAGVLFVTCDTPAALHRN